MRIASASSVIALHLIAAFALTGCNKKTEDTKDEATVSAATEEGKDAKKPSGPCDELATKLCAEAGEQSATCQSAKSSYALLGDATCQAGIKDFTTTKTKLADMRKDCDQLIEVLCTGVGPETKTCGMVKEKTKQFPPEQCTKMLGEKDQIIAQLKAEEMKNQPLTPELQGEIAAATAPSFGPADAKVTLVEFSDFECPYCSRAASVTKQIKEKYGDKVRFVFRQFPLSFHKNAQGAAEASMAAQAQGKFWELHDLMFENQRQLGAEELQGYAKQIGLDMTKFNKALESHEYAAQVKADTELGTKVAVQGTPTLFINGERVGNPTDFAGVSAQIDAALAK